MTRDFLSEDDDELEGDDELEEEDPYDLGLYNPTDSDGEEDGEDGDEEGFEFVELEQDGVPFVETLDSILIAEEAQVVWTVSILANLSPGLPVSLVYSQDLMRVVRFFSALN